MSARIVRVVLFWLLSSTLGCTPPNPNVRRRLLPGGGIEVDGPLAGPFKDLADLAENACQLMTSQPGASTGRHGMEYCALHYYSQEEQAFFLSYLSDIGGNAAGGKKFCKVPRSLNDPKHKHVIVLGPAHTHPHNRRFSGEDLSRKRQWTPLRFFDETTGRIWDSDLLVFYREPSGECSSYSYNYSSRIISALRQGQWLPIGKAMGIYGEVELLEGQDWLP
ncbi:MAG: hypothetical protein JXB05_17340 [Myxococcaceae bacterium]|nr:hypothetical protein [Myxococcaceae bacterium]